MAFNAAASVANLAKAMLFDLDRKSLATSVPTPQLELILQTLVDLAEPQVNHELRDRVTKNHMGLMTAFSEAVRGDEEARAEAEARAARGG